MNTYAVRATAYINADDPKRTIERTEHYRIDAESADEAREIAANQIDPTGLLPVGTTVQRLDNEGDDERQADELRDDEPIPYLLAEDPSPLPYAPLTMVELVNRSEEADCRLGSAIRYDLSDEEVNERLTVAREINRAFRIRGRKVA